MVESLKGGNPVSAWLEFSKVRGSREGKYSIKSTEAYCFDFCIPVEASKQPKGVGFMGFGLIED